ncbi:nucleoside triphosphate pyrophosphohydrolase [Amphiplicatus metriothermophilus]|uniref:Nucleoside triphosphate pyrophosphohydrolase n=1 Tax=Amphiplicatus metriothermophilus TaxID=1519374 RepID=A0A239PQA7_9PROT|nr:nucleoside triphosphate pyrophosphohydrolase [Amphiplicatus metriothermophilus]MBB5518609.1 MazG family protein [Amphiplicatus metriothermophilus]SNT72233.1 tetrapyrrole methylase family protein / MazG family protein/ATP diphosphatase [Amphiplicatus metriothermophilus]
MSRAINELLDIMARLRSPDGGCPWDLEQTFRTIAPYAIEEAYEVADAIERDDMAALKEELGDLLFQVVFHARMAEERGAFDFADVVAAICDKMIRRHPHVFEAPDGRDADAQTAAWEDQKAEERRAKGAASLLDDVPVALPGLARAVKLQKRAARVGFDWTNVEDVLAKLEEEVRELQAAACTKSADAIEDEFGDLLFVIANVARHLRVDPEAALRRANEKFARRFRHIETRLAAAGRDLAEASLDEMEALWTEAKRGERGEKE